MSIMYTFLRSKIWRTSCVECTNPTNQRRSHSRCERGSTEQFRPPCVCAFRVLQGEVSLQELSATPPFHCRIQGGESVCAGCCPSQHEMSSVRSRNPKSGSPYYILIEFLTERQTVATLSIYRVFRVVWQFSKGNQCEPPPFKTHGNSNIIHMFRINDVHLSGETGPSKERTNICCNFRSTEVH